MTKIIVPLDGSVHSAHALGPAERLARVFQGRIELIRMISDGAGETALADQQSADAARQLDAIVAGIASDIPAQGRIIDGREPASEIVSFAGVEEDTYIVMSTRGYGSLGRMVFGSVADGVVRQAHVPVVLVHGEPPLKTGAIRRILVPLDGSRLAELALPLATDLAHRSDATISLVQVIDVPSSAAYRDFGFATSSAFDDIERSRNEARSYLDTVAGQLRGSGVRVTWEVRVGAAAQEIARAATTTGTDLIVMSTHGRTGVRRFVLGSVMLDVVKSEAAPVIVVPTVAGEPLDATEPRQASSSCA